MGAKGHEAEERRVLKIYQGILLANAVFEPGASFTIRFAMDAPEWKILNERYSLERIAGEGNAYQRAFRLMAYLAPRLAHAPDYDNHVPMDAPSLLAYAYEQPEHGINCLNKAKILQECCLAVGIPARRVFMMPYSAYDSENHVIVEIYDEQWEKWIFLDPTYGYGAFNEKGEPIGLLEMRDILANGAMLFVADKPQTLASMRKGSLPQTGIHAYYAKNLAYFYLESIQGFGVQGERLGLIPRGFDPAQREKKAYHWADGGGLPRARLISLASFIKKP